MTIDASRIPQLRQNTRDRDLAARYAPLIYFDRNEPFFSLCAGYTIFKSDALSASFPRHIHLTGEGHPPAALAIEYAIWWDWDIQHLYEIEHTWTYVGTDGHVVYAEASWHGGFGPGVLEDGTVQLQKDETGEHPVIFSEPGKHAFAPRPEMIMERRKDETLRSCGPKAGTGGLWVTPLFKGILDLRKNAAVDARITAYLRQSAFTPAFIWNHPFLITRDMLVPWPKLFEWVPARIDWWLEQLNK